MKTRTILLFLAITFGITWGLAALLMIAEQLPKLVEEQVKAISNLKKLEGVRRELGAGAAELPLVVADSDEKKGESEEWYYEDGLSDYLSDATIDFPVIPEEPFVGSFSGNEEGVDWAGRVLAGRDRTGAGIAAPPHGLTLVRVCYPGAFDIPAPFELGQ